MNFKHNRPIEQLFPLVGMLRLDTNGSSKTKSILVQWYEMTSNQCLKSDILTQEII